MKNPEKRLFINIFSNWVGTGVGAIIAFIMTPFLVHTLGKDAYGVWALIFSIIAYTNFFDAGMKQSLARYLPKYYGIGDYKNLNKVINSSLVIYMITGTLVVILTLIISYFFLDLLKSPPELIPSMQVALIFIGLNQACYFYFMPVAALGPFHRYDILNAIEITKFIITALLFYYFLINGHGIVTMAIVIFSASFVAFNLRRIIQRRLVPQIKIATKYIDSEKIRALLRYGGISFFIVISWLVIFNTDNIVIGLYISTSAVTIYSIAGTIINYLRTIISSVGVPFVPTVSHLESDSRNDEIIDLFNKINCYLYYFTTCICIGLLFFVDDFINLWMGPGFEQTIEILYILIIPASIYLPQVMANSILMGIGKHKLLLKIISIEAISNIILSLILVRSYGIYGVAFGTIIPQLIIYSTFFPILFHRTIKADIKQFYLISIRIIVLGALVSIPFCYIMNEFVVIGGWFDLVMKIITIGFINIAFFMLKIIKSEDKKKILAFFPFGKRKR